MSIDAEILNETLAYWIQQYTKKILHRDRVGFIPRLQGCFGVHRTGTMMHHINKMKDEKQTIMTVGAKKVFDNI